ncbi:MAG: Rrf2 family transcriptional regulator [Candidatus Omnitrophica bacterium]|nr:Rrf2 family transcriptional regulator [Candidatus Omnitrophota bacterium]
MINKSSLLAIKALTELAQLPPGECEGAGSIAQKINAPANYLGKILQSLASRGLIISQKGKGGGFRLERSPKKIRLFDIVAAIEDTGKWSKCFLGRKQCLDSSPCHVHDQWKHVKETNIKFLEGINLYDLGK